MDNPGPAQAASLGDLAECLRQLHVRADRPSLRQLEEHTRFANGLLPGTRLERVRLRRTTLNDVLRGLKFPRKAFLLTFVEALNVDLEADRRWEQAWDRLAVDQADEAGGRASRASAEAGQLRKRLAEAGDRAAAAEAAQTELAQQLAGAKAETEQLRADAEAAAQAAAKAGLSSYEADQRRERLEAEAGQLRKRLAEAEERAAAAENEAARMRQEAENLAEKLQTREDEIGPPSTRIHDDDRWTS